MGQNSNAFLSAFCACDATAQVASSAGASDACQGWRLASGCCRESGPVTWLYFMQLPRSPPLLFTQRKPTEQSVSNEQSPVPGNTDSDLGAWKVGMP